MSKKDYELIARVLRNTPHAPSASGKDASYIAMRERDHLAQAFADALADTNVRFDSTRFLTACGVS